jgi:hypothetical protein
MKLAPQIHPWGQCFNLKSQISNLKSIDAPYSTAIFRAEQSVDQFLSRLEEPYKVRSLEEQVKIFLISHI